MKSKAWYVYLPGGTYALGPVRFDRPVGEREARQWVRDWLKVKRLPNGTELWPTR